MGKVTTGAYQATGKKMEGTNAQSNFAAPAKMGKVKATEPLPAASNPKPFIRKALPGMRSPAGTAGGIPRQAPTFAAGPIPHTPHVRNPGE